MGETPERWIVIPNWSEYQHYKKRDPSWIKGYTRQLSDDDYLALTFSQRGLLDGLRLAYAESDGQLRGRSTTLTRRLGQKVSTRTLEALNHAGFIAFTASKPLALRYQVASPETEEEKEKDNPLPPSQKKSKAKTNGKIATLLEAWIRNGGGELTPASVEDEIAQREKKRGEKIKPAERQRLLALAAALSEPEPSLEDEPKAPA